MWRTISHIVVPGWMVLVLAQAGCVGSRDVPRPEVDEGSPLAAPARGTSMPGDETWLVQVPEVPTEPPLVEVSTEPDEWQGWPARGSRMEEDRISRMLRKAARLVGRGSLRGVTQQVRDDCTGFVEWVFKAAEMDLFGASQEMFAMATRMGALHQGPPRPGDLAFFEETYDKNRDGRRNDGITHVAVVESADDQGNVVFLHRGGKGIARSRMSTLHPRTRMGPEGQLLNDYLRPAKGKARAYFAGELFRGYASVGRLLETQTAWSPPARSVATRRNAVR